MLMEDGGFDSSRVFAPLNLPFKAKKKMLMPRGQLGGGGGEGGGGARLKLTDVYIDKTSNISR